MFCHRCGAKIADGAAFCHKCGTKVAVKDIEPQPCYTTQNADSAQCEKEAFPETPVSGVQQTDEGSNQMPAIPPKFNEDPNSDPTESDEWWENCSKTKKIFVILGALLIAGIVLYLLVSFWEVLCGALVVMGIIGALFMGTPEERKETRRQFLGLIVFVIIICVVMLNWNAISNIIQPGASVRNAYLSQYSETVTIGDAFSAFFENEKWSTYKEGGYSYVAFTGTCEYSGKKRT